ncbi:hypothetical protein, partial [Methylobacterium sp. WL103]|uniref:hypothetical protein n=1 Tax=Methylobacterium sp. WL103 TaxID=2603891 RepID=UPI001AEDF246
LEVLRHARRGRCNRASMGAAMCYARDMTRWLEIVLFIAFAVLAVAIVWWFGFRAGPVGGLAQ